MNARWIKLISLLAGGGDLSTGLLLIVVPRQTLHMMGVPAPQEEIFIRFIGCFVAVVGFCYFLGLLWWRASGAPGRLRVVWEITAIFRLVIGVFVGVAVLGGQLAAPWWSVSLCDGWWCVIQTSLLRRGIFEPLDEGK